MKFAQLSDLLSPGRVHKWIVKELLVVKRPFHDSEADLVGKDELLTPLIARKSLDSAIDGRRKPALHKPDSVLHESKETRG